MSLISVSNLSIPSWRFVEDHVEYEIVYQVSTPTSSSTAVTIESRFARRRYNHFHTLASRMGDKRLMQSLPGKKIFGNRDPAFVEARRVALERWLAEAVAGTERGELSPLQREMIYEFLQLRQQQLPSQHPSHARSSSIGENTGNNNNNNSNDAAKAGNSFNDGASFASNALALSPTSSSPPGGSNAQKEDEDLEMKQIVANFQQELIFVNESPRNSLQSGSSKTTAASTSSTSATQPIAVSRGTEMLAASLFLSARSASNSVSSLNPTASSAAPTVASPTSASKASNSSSFASPPSATNGTAPPASLQNQASNGSLSSQGGSHASPTAGATSPTHNNASYSDTSGGSLVHRTSPTSQTARMRFRARLEKYQRIALSNLVE